MPATKRQLSFVSLPLGFMVVVLGSSNVFSLFRKQLIPLRTFCFVWIGQTLRAAAMWTAKSNFSHTIEEQKRPEHMLVTTGVYRQDLYGHCSPWIVFVIILRLFPCAVTFVIRLILVGFGGALAPKYCWETFYASSRMLVQVVCFPLIFASARCRRATYRCRICGSLEFLPWPHPVRGGKFATFFPVTVPGLLPQDDYRHTFHSFYHRYNGQGGIFESKVAAGG